MNSIRTIIIAVGEIASIVDSRIRLKMDKKVDPDKPLLSGTLIQYPAPYPESQFH